MNRDLLSLPWLTDCRGEGVFPILDRRCWSYAWEESFTLRREQSKSSAGRLQYDIEFSQRYQNRRVVCVHVMFLFTHNEPEKLVETERSGGSILIRASVFPEKEGLFGLGSGSSITMGSG